MGPCRDLILCREGLEQEGNANQECQPSGEVAAKKAARRFQRGSSETSVSLRLQQLGILPRPLAKLSEL